MGRSSPTLLAAIDGCGGFTYLPRARLHAPKLDAKRRSSARDRASRRPMYEDHCFVRSAPQCTQLRGGMKVQTPKNAPGSPPIIKTGDPQLLHRNRRRRKNSSVASAASKTINHGENLTAKSRQTKLTNSQAASESNICFLILMIRIRTSRIQTNEAPCLG